MARYCALLAFLLAYFFAPGSALALTKVTLSSGETVEGTILEERPDGSLRMISVKGEDRVLLASEIARIDRPSLPPAAPVPAAPTVGTPAAPSPAPSVASTPEPATTSDSAVQRRAPVATSPHWAPQGPVGADRYDGWYFGGLVGGAVAPSFPGVAGVGGATVFLGFRFAPFDLRLSLGGVGATFDTGSLGFVTARTEIFFWVAEPYGLAVGVAPCAGYFEDEYVGEGALGGVLLSATPVAFRFDVGSVFLEPSLSLGAIVGSVEPAEGVFTRPFALLGLAVYSQ